MVEVRVNVSHLHREGTIWRKGDIIEIDEEDVARLGNSVTRLTKPEPAPFLSASTEPQKTTEVLIEEPKTEESENVQRKGEGRKEKGKGQRQEVEPEPEKKKPKPRR